MKFTSMRVAFHRTGSLAMIVPTLRDLRKCAGGSVVPAKRNLTIFQPIGSIVFY